MYFSTLPWWLTLVVALLFVGGFLASAFAWRRLPDGIDADDNQRSVEDVLAERVFRFDAGDVLGTSTSCSQRF